MLSFPNCKINLGLNIIQKRNDGFHDLETVFYPLRLMDALEIVPHSNDNKESSVLFTSSGMNIEGNPEDNLCVKAVELIKKDFPKLPPVQLHLHKTIPAGAGLGGGSADAAFTLTLLNKKFNLGISTEKMLDYALQLGSDCPFFIINKTCFATGRGEFLETIALDLSQYKFLLVNPIIHIDTAWAFRTLSGDLRNIVREKGIKQVIQQPITTWKDELTNDFEIPVFNAHPEIHNIKEELYKHNAIYASMSGSGSTVYGIFNKETNISIPFPQHYFVKELIGQ